ncbi:type II secretion system protein [Candidatus Saccharibacteria bacterium]|nr:type II secretion system protein [Candidatus Saccharibacteria bacterium]
MNLQLKEKGFTIIEVVLVLAIAGLIFLMVFIALPALQRNQRDSQRKNDLSRAQTALVSYQSNNRNASPGVTDALWATFKTQYLIAGTDTFEDPSFGSYIFKFKDTTRTAPSTSVADNGEIWVFSSSTCNGETISSSASVRKVALAMKLEGGGVSCVNN